MSRRRAYGRSFKQRYGPWAVVTGASAGIGRAFAAALARQGLNVVVVARREQLLETLATELSDRFAVSVKPVVCDLSLAEEVESLWCRLAGLDIGLLVNNAGAPSYHGHFSQRRWEDIESSVVFNTAIQARMLHHAVKGMCERGRGGIVQVCSITGHTPVPFMAEYSANKSYQLALAESLHFELRERGVDVLAVSPGATRSERIDYGMEPEEVVAAALGSLGRTGNVVPGRLNRLRAFRFRHLNSRMGALRRMGRFQKSRLA